MKLSVIFSHWWLSAVHFPSHFSLSARKKCSKGKSERKENSKFDSLFFVAIIFRPHFFPIFLLPTFPCTFFFNDLFPIIFPFCIRIFTFCYEIIINVQLADERATAGAATGVGTVGVSPNTTSFLLVETNKLKLMPENVIIRFSCIPFAPQPLRRARRAEKE